MSFEDRRPPFAWLGLDALARIRDELPVARHAAARNALLALAEASSKRRDGKHQNGDTLREIADLAGVSERRFRGHLADLEAIGAVRIEAFKDPLGRDLPTKYILTDGPPVPGRNGSDVPSPHPDAVASQRHPLSRAHVRDEEEERSREGERAHEDPAEWASPQPTGDPTVDEVVGILRKAPRLRFDPLLAGISNVLAAHAGEGVDFRKAAHLTVAKLTDPNYRTTDAGQALNYVIEGMRRSAAHAHPAKPSGRRTETSSGPKKPGKYMQAVMNRPDDWTPN